MKKAALTFILMLGCSSYQVQARGRSKAICARNIHWMKALRFRIGCEEVRMYLGDSRAIEEKVKFEKQFEKAKILLIQLGVPEEELPAVRDLNSYLINKCHGNVPNKEDVSQLLKDFLGDLWCMLDKGYKVRLGRQWIGRLKKMEHRIDYCESEKADALAAIAT